MTEERTEIVRDLAPISMNTRNIPSIEECIMAIEAPSFRSDELNATMGLIHLVTHIKALQGLLESSLKVLEEVKVNGPPEWEIKMGTYIDRVREEFRNHQ